MKTIEYTKPQPPAALPQATCSVPVAAVDQLVRQLERIERLESALTEIMNLCQATGLGVEAQAFQATLIAQRALKPNPKLSDRT